LEITNHTQNVTYDASGNKRVEEKDKSNSSFENDLNETNKKEEEEKEITSKLLESLMFTFRTGMTKEEYEKILDDLKELQDKIKEGNYSYDEVTEMLKEIERDILRIKKEITGEPIKELTNSLGELAQKIEAKPQKAVDLIQQLIDRISDAKKQLEDMEKGQDKKGHGVGSTVEELERLQRLKQNLL